MVLETVAEMIDLIGGTPYARRADAIEMLERLLPDAALSPPRYHAVLREHPDLVAPALAAVRLAADGPRSEVSSAVHASVARSAT